MKKIAIASLVVAVACSLGFAAQNYVGPSGSVQWSNDSSTIESGDLVDIGSRYGVALSDIESNYTGTVATEGQFKFLHSTSTVVARGSAAYYNNATSITLTAASSKYVGEVINSAAATASTQQWVIVDINAPYPTAYVDGVVTNVTSTNATLVIQRTNVRP